jgi:hypothetical protein
MSENGTTRGHHDRGWYRVSVLDGRQAILARRVATNHLAAVIPSTVRQGELPHATNF